MQPQGILTHILRITCLRCQGYCFLSVAMKLVCFMPVATNYAAHFFLLTP